MLLLLAVSTPASRTSWTSSTAWAPREAAPEQILEFMSSALLGEPSIDHPAGCTLVTSDGSCAFSGMW
jgi:hypothetical protein